MGKFRVLCATYNGHLSAGSPTHPGKGISSWLSPTLDEAGVGAGSEEAPDFVAVGFQEMIPLHLALMGLTRVALDSHDYLLKSSIEEHVAAQSSSSKSGERETYTLMAKKVLGGIALLIYTRDSTVTSKVVDVRVAHAACGIAGLMGNKGGVGVRIVLDEADDEDSSAPKQDEEDDSTGHTVFTFVTAHLAAHGKEKDLKRRNWDYRQLVERLVFDQQGASDHFTVAEGRRRDVFKGLRRKLTPGDPKAIQIYDTSYLFVFGDLNYRISTTKPKPLALHLISHKIANDLPSLLTHDQLTHEQSAGLTLHHLREGPITFQPTYKYKVGTVSEYKNFKKRIPGWCDRILFATWADGPDGAGRYEVTEKDGSTRQAKRKGAKVELYKSVMSFTDSDHKPVTAVFALPRQPKGEEGRRPLRLPWSAPYKIDAGWKQKQTIGWAMDRFVGLVWCLLVLAGFNKDARLGLANIFAAALAAYYRKNLFGL